MSESEQNLSVQPLHPFAQLTFIPIFLWSLFLGFALGFGLEFLRLVQERDSSPLNNQLGVIVFGLFLLIFALILLQKLVLAGFSHLAIWGPPIKFRELATYIPPVLFQIFLSMLVVSFTDLSIDQFFSGSLDWLSSSASYEPIYLLPDASNEGLDWLFFNLSSFLGAVVIAPIAEEIIFRGWILHRLTVVFRSPGKAVLISSLIFGSLHGVGFVGCTCIGLYLGIVYLRTGSLRLIVYLHALSNLLVFLISLGLEFLLLNQKFFSGPILTFTHALSAPENGMALWLAEGILLSFLFGFFIHQIRKKWPTPQFVLPLFPDGIPVRSRSSVSQLFKTNLAFESVPLAGLRLHHAFFMLCICLFLVGSIRIVLEMNKDFLGAHKTWPVFSQVHSLFLSSNGWFLLNVLVVSLGTFGAWILWLYFKFRPLPIHFSDLWRSPQIVRSWRLLCAFAVFQWIWSALTQGPLHFLPARLHPNHWGCCIQYKNSGLVMGLVSLFVLNALIWAWAEQLGRQLLLYRLKSHYLILAASVGFFICLHRHNPINAIVAGLWLGYLTLCLKEPGTLMRFLFLYNTKFAGS